MDRAGVRGGLLIAAVALVALPAAAHAAGDPAVVDLVIDFEKSGLMKELLAKTLRVARSFLFFSAFLAYALEAFGKPPSAPHDYAAVSWRLVVVVFLLWGYQPIFGGVINLIDRVEQEVAPPSTWAEFKAQAARMRAALDDVAEHGEAAPAAATATPANPSPAQPGPAPSRIASWAYEGLISCLQLLAEGLVFVLRWLSRILTATLFILGPLALVAAIPRPSSTGTRWFHRFVTIASWPIFGGVLLSVMVTLDAQGKLQASYLQCLVASLVMLVTTLATPSLASHVVGGALENFAGSGFGSAKGAKRDFGNPVGRVALAVGGGVKSRVGSAVSRMNDASAGRGGATSNAPGLGGRSGRGGGGRRSGSP